MAPELIKERALKYYSQNETKVDLGFFLAGFIFDVFTLSSVDDTFSIIQQSLYLLILLSLFGSEFLVESKVMRIPASMLKMWESRSFITHFLLGSLLSIYSLFFLKSASAFVGILFVLVLMLVMVLNELKFVQSRGVDTKFSLFVLTLLCFMTTLGPVVFGFVGFFPFFCALLLTAGIIAGFWYLLKKRVSPEARLEKRILAPAGVVLGSFFVLYTLGWIPPVPLAVEEIGIYHKIEKSNGNYQLFHERSWWKFWQNADEDFQSQPNDRIHVFARIYSPARFSDQVVLHWQLYTPSQGWMTSDKIPMTISGGREGGYRGHAFKSNYVEGDWRVLVETNDGREIGRVKFSVTKVAAVATREFQIDER